MQPHGLQHARSPCLLPISRVYSNSSPLSWWCHPTVSSFVIPFSSCLQSFQHQGLFKWVSSLHQMTKVLDYTVKVRNRFKGLDLIDRVPQELWTEVHDIVQEAGIKTISKKKKCKKSKWLSEEGLQIAEKRREVKGKGKKERYTHLN